MCVGLCALLVRFSDVSLRNAAAIADECHFDCATFSHAQRQRTGPRKPTECVLRTAKQRNSARKTRKELEGAAHGSRPSAAAIRCRHMLRERRRVPSPGRHTGSKPVAAAAAAAAAVNRARADAGARSDGDEPDMRPLRLLRNRLVLLVLAAADALAQTVHALRGRYEYLTKPRNGIRWQWASGKQNQTCTGASRGMLCASLHTGRGSERHTASASAPAARSKPYKPQKPGKKR